MNVPSADMASANAQELQAIYSRRFQSNQRYRKQIWDVLVTELFQEFVPPSGVVLDLGCGYGEFINAVKAGTKYAMDLNPSSAEQLDSDVRLLLQDCSARWNLPDSSLDVVFTSNFFEHLPDKATLGRTLDQARRCLRPGGKIIAMGPNIKHIPGAYWDFWDHFLPLTETSLAEGLRTHGFEVVQCHGRFLPYTMVNVRQYPPFFLKCYLHISWAWRWFGKQFLVVAQKPLGVPTSAC